MADRPILFSAPMVRALLAGTKTQTRRVLKPQPFEHQGRWWITDRVGGDCHLDDWLNDRVGVGPAIQPGDRLWVRETLKRDPDLWVYSADGVEVGWPARKLLAPKRQDYAPSIHMPKAASRLTLTVTDVRVERLQDISEEDALAEGVWTAAAAAESGVTNRSAGGSTLNHIGAYRSLWEDINGPGSWGANPWVAAYTFTVERRNIDAVPGTLADADKEPSP